MFGNVSPCLVQSLLCLVLLIKILIIIIIIIIIIVIIPSGRVV
jgi:hypothetical protein